jgi:hypothetical protein
MAKWFSREDAAAIAQKLEFPFEERGARSEDGRARRLRLARVALRRRSGVG